jgi:hypothetical protein
MEDLTREARVGMIKHGHRPVHHSVPEGVATRDKPAMVAWAQAPRFKS